MFMLVGMVAGSEGLGIIHFENYELTYSLSLIAICVIIFSGGLSTQWSDIRPVLREGILLSTVGVLLTTFILALFVYLLFDITIIESLLLGATLGSTDAAAVFASFRDRSSQVKKRLKSVLELESGSNDPMAYFLVTIFLGYYQMENSSSAILALKLITNPLIGVGIGLGISWLFKYINDNIDLDYIGLYPALTIAFLFLNYSLTTQLGGNGLLSIYIFGVYIGNQKIMHKNSLITYVDGTSWLAQIGLFVMLGVLVFPSRMLEVAPIGIIVTLFLLLFARPIAVFLCLIRSKFDLKEKVFISWAGLKGATPIVFAAFVATVPHPTTRVMFDIVFFTVLISALLQGSSLKWLARRFNLIFESINDPEFPVDLDLIEKTKNGIKQFKLKMHDYAVGKRIIDINLPKGAVVLFIARQGQFIVPDGSTVFEEGDKVLLLTNNKEEIETAIDCFKNLREVALS